MRFVLVLLLSLIPIAIGYIAWQDFQSPGPLLAEKALVIPRGTGFRDTAELLAAEGIIAHPLFFDAMAIATGNARNFKAGEYLFTPGITPEQVMELLASGKVIVHKLTLPEGWRSLDAVEMLNEQTLLTGEMAVPAEGTLLPETYYYLRGDARADILHRMQADMEKTLAELWLKRKDGLPYQAPLQVVVLASIVEKETGLAEERPHIAAVFLNRLKKNMPLQSDPTTIYAIEKDKGPLGRALMTGDLQYDSPYNTYKYPGLPPGPICNPGRASLEAVLNPMESDDLYFVATGTGGHTFSAALKDHNNNVKKYRAEIKKKKKA
jgi:UPF0755 protein